MTIRKMIQRVQTLFLLAVAVAMGLMFMLPIWEKTDLSQERKMELDAFYFYEYKSVPGQTRGWEETVQMPVYYIAIVAGLSALLSMVVIFMFKNRLLQMKLCALNAFLMMATLGITAYFIYNGENALGFEGRGLFRAGFFMPVVGLILNSLASRFIRKDEKLVRSVDRIR